MKKLFAIALLIFIISCKSMSESEMKEKAKQGIVEYFNEKHKGVIIDSLNVVSVEPVKEGRVVHKVNFTIQTTDPSEDTGSKKIRIDIMTKDVVYMDKDFKVIE